MPRPPAIAARVRSGSGSPRSSLARGATAGSSADGGAGVTTRGRYTEFTDGVRAPTGGAYDLALHGEGFFTVRDTQGKIVTERYWKED